MALLRLLAALATACIPLVAAHKAYASLFPNGRSVPCAPRGAPGCSPNGTCLAVGHAGCVGGGPLNDCGRALAAANYAWTAELCMADSDGDGLSGVYCNSLGRIIRSRRLGIYIS